MIKYTSADLNFLAQFAILFPDSVKKKKAQMKPKK